MSAHTARPEGRAHLPTPSAVVAPCSAIGAQGPAALVGNTPALWIGGSGTTDRGFWAKLESANPGGMKDRPALHMIDAARKRGELAPGGRVVESTSGTLGLGLALAGSVYEHPVTLVTDPGMDGLLRRMLTAYGAELDVVAEPHPTGGWQEARRQRVAELQARAPGSYCPDQYFNPDNVAGYRSLALELVAQLGRVDVLVCSVGTGGHSAGVSRVLREFFPQLRLVGVDTIGSTIFGQPARPRVMRGLGSSIYPRNVDYSAFDEVHWVGPAEATWMCRHLAKSQLATGGWSVGAAAVVANWVARHESSDTRIAAVFPDGPHRYAETIFDDRYCRERGLLDGELPEEPETIRDPSDREVRRWTRCSTVLDPLAETTSAPTGAR